MYLIKNTKSCSGVIREQAWDQFQYKDWIESWSTRQEGHKKKKIASKKASVIQCLWDIKQEGHTRKERGQDHRGPLLEKHP